MAPNFDGTAPAEASSLVSQENEDDTANDFEINGSNEKAWLAQGANSAKSGLAMQDLHANHNVQTNTSPNTTPQRNRIAKKKNINMINGYADDPDDDGARGDGDVDGGDDHSQICFHKIGV